jgi:nitrite reductase (NADH) large subunit
MGALATDADTRTLVYQDRSGGIYKKLVLRNGIVIGALLFGDVADSQQFFNLIQDQCAVGSDYCRLLLAGEVPAMPALATA